MLALCAAFSLGTAMYAQPSAAKRTAAEQAAKDAEKAAKKAAKSSNSARVRLDANFETDPLEETVAELHAKYRNESGKIRLDAEAEGLDDGTVVQVYVGGIKIGDITVVEGVGEISFRDAASWPAGLPMELTAGTMVRFLDAAGNILAEGPFVNK